MAFKRLTSHALSSFRIGANSIMSAHPGGQMIIDPRDLVSMLDEIEKNRSTLAPADDTERVTAEVTDSEKQALTALQGIVSRLDTLIELMREDDEHPVVMVDFETQPPAAFPFFEDMAKRNRDAGKTEDPMAQRLARAEDRIAQLTSGMKRIDANMDKVWMRVNTIEGRINTQDHNLARTEVTYVAFIQGSE